MSSGVRSGGMPSVRIELADGRCIQGFIDEGYGPLADAFRANTASFDTPLATQNAVCPILHQRCTPVARCTNYLLEKLC